MGFLRVFFRQKVPKPGKEMPAYYRTALAISEALLCVNFLISLILFFFSTERLLWFPALMLAGAVFCLFTVKKMNARRSLLLYTLLVFLWCGWYVNAFGWGCGSQHLLLTILVLVFFNIYEPAWSKAAYFAVLLLYRMLLFSWSLDHAALFMPDRSVNIALQLANSFTLFIILGLDFIRFSTSIQDTERELRLDNQELSREAGTDPLTQLPNRRAMLDLMEAHQASSPGEQFCIAIADIDLFKDVNDTYGHNCGDYTLKALAALFRASAGGNYRVCRWGGEEFLFFLPGKNLDEAGRVMNDLRIAVGRMALSFEDVDFSITLTVGVEENDFRSSMDDILGRADQKLYMGKTGGRNQVVI